MSIESGKGIDIPYQPFEECPRSRTQTIQVAMETQNAIRQTNTQA